MIRYVPRYVVRVNKIQCNSILPFFFCGSGILTIGIAAVMVIQPFIVPKKYENLHQFLLHSVYNECFLI